MRELAGTAGAAATGALTGIAVSGIWNWGIREDAKVCKDAPSVCVTYYPLYALGLTIAIVLVLVPVGLWISRVRPLQVSVPVCLVLMAYVLLRSGDWLYAPGSPSLQLTWPFVLICAIGPALVATARIRRLQVPALSALGILIVVSLFAGA
ncbi:hypothetical protein ABT237_39765 [Streptomyces sp. NPDC001581]|uniref:hypothetical protein n=1 Tax=Streptomyces sp. NPDC001581 TaxID=3154386 RepID=UPI00331D2446